MSNYEKTLKIMAASNSAASNLQLLGILLDAHGSVLRPEEIKYGREYIERGHHLIETNRLHRQKDATWSNFNFRHGANSIIGTYNEFLAAVIFNSNNPPSGARYIIPITETRHEQVSGIDLFVVSPRWRNEYTVQVKTFTAYDDMAFLVHPNHLRYDGAKVDRVVYVDRNRNKIYQFPYSSLKNLVLSQYPELINSISESTSSVRILIQDALRLPKACVMTLREV